MPIYTHQIELEAPPEEVFRWHGRPGAFARLTPPWESIRVRERTGGLEVGARVVLGIKKGPMEIRWTVQHTEYEEGRRFVDEQVEGPFEHWRHEHRFEPAEGGGTTLVDTVDWAPPLGSAGEVFTRGFITGSLERLFAFRARRLRNDLGLHSTYGPGDGRRVAVTGSTGLVGTALVALLRSGGYDVLRISRRETDDPDWVQWDPEGGVLDPAAMEGLNAVVHLAGEPISGVRWTRTKKEEILESREAGTRFLARTLAELKHPPEVLVSASGAGFYGDRGDEKLTEDGGPGEGFLAEVCRRWEAATHPARAMNIRTIHLRSAAVLSPQGGLLGTVLLPFNLGLGGRLGSGRQYMSWIDLDDETGLILHAIREPSLRGPVNAAAPNPVPNAAFTDVLGRVLGRPTVLPVPSMAIRILLGEMGKELLLSGQRLVPEQARATGYGFMFPDLEDSLRHQLGRPDAESGSPTSRAT